MKEVIKFLLKYINIKPMLKDAIDIHLEKLIMSAVAKSSTKIDDAVVPLVYAAIEKEALDAIDKVNLEELFKIEETK